MRRSSFWTRASELLLMALLVAGPFHVANAQDLIGTVTHVRDGDTIEVGDVAVRLQGLHAPEGNEVGGSDATAFMTNLVLGRGLVCNLTGERSHDRLIGICYLDGKDIAAELVAAGLGRDCPRYSGGRYAPLDRRPDMLLPDYCH